MRCGNGLSHKLEVGKRRSFASHYTLTTAQRVWGRLSSPLKTTFGALEVEKIASGDSNFSAVYEIIASAHKNQAFR